MTFPELLPLLQKVEVLRDNPSTREILDFVRSEAEKARTASMAQSICSTAITMTHAKAWGDLNVQGFGNTWIDWFAYLSQLKQVADDCGQAIFNSYSSASPRGG